jgi:hypothetical protein
MLARLLLALLGVEIGVYGVAGIALVSRGVLRTSTALMLAAAVFLLLRVAVIALSFALSRPGAGAVSSRLPAMQRIELFCGECLAFILLFSILQPLGVWFARPQRHNADAGAQPPVLLVHGIYCNATLWWWFTKNVQDAPPLAVGRNERSWGGFDAHPKMQLKLF